MKLQSLALMTGIAVSGIVTSGAFAPAQAVGVLLTSEVGYTGPALDLSAYANGSYNFTVGPKSIPGGITFTSTVNLADTQSGFGSVLGQGAYNLDANGNFDASRVYAGLDAAKGYMTFSFAAPVQSFGAFLNYAPGYGVNPLPGIDPGDNPTISTYDINNNLLSSFDLSVFAPISTPGGVNQFAFRGISELTASIASFRLGGSYILATGTANGAVPVPATDVPEPFTIIGTLVGGSAALRMRKKLKSSNN
ncbi:PEP-CTERM sorting domain-containing protein [Chamaesiphon sp. VAR_48_metabat_135_sub]|uniref:PEP-CTERM sorting domain-containing protein n=1 Tax=Chamaesiphon sp. VAR_48_metabat_135_sub TaxID=2964699 RepID=UPI00286B0888|nr:PEP-CTERM sorting domain-containing protein [Chamaesiphon sp. VAR_48_metabat_135_sub]